MYTKILVALDGSEFSEEIIPCAVGMGARTNTPVELLRVVPGSADETQVRAYMDRLASAHGARARHLRSDEDVAEVLLREVEQTPGTLLAMTSRGRSGLMEAVLGSVTKQLVRRSRAPVLVWHPGRKGEQAPVNIKTVVLPLDGRPLSESMRAPAAELAKWLDAELLVVGVINPKDRTAALSARQSGRGQSTMEASYVRASANDLAEHHGVQASWETLHGDNAADAIADYLSNRNDVLLAMASRGNAPMKTAVIGSVTGALLGRGGHPMLIRAASADPGH